MALYYVDKDVQKLGEHTIHQGICNYLPATENRIYLGDFKSCLQALEIAKTIYKKIDGCHYCSLICHRI